MKPIRLERRGHPEWTTPPARIVHLGLGAFFRAHQAWFTAHADDANQWGIAAFSGHSAGLAARLGAQNGLYTLATRGPDGDSIEVIPSVVAAHPGTDIGAWRSAVADPQVEVMTLTVTEAAYNDGSASVAPRLLDGLDARRRADTGPITLVPCDNVPENATALGDLVRGAAERTRPELLGWLDESVRVVGSVVDRITPAPTDTDVETAARFGYVDTAPVVTEPFSEWIVSGDFAVSRPAWETAGAVFVGDLGPYTRRKLHLLNGAHSLLAYAGLLRGHVEVANAIHDRELRDLVEDWWDEAVDTVGGDRSALDAYRSALIERFENERIHHRLAQIAIDGSTKLPVRVVPVARFERARGRAALMSAAIIGAWVAYVEQAGERAVDARADRLRHAVSESRGVGREIATRLVDVIASDLAEDAAFMAAVLDASDRFREAT